MSTQRQREFDERNSGKHTHQIADARRCVTISDAPGGVTPAQPACRHRRRFISAAASLQRDASLADNDDGLVSG